jgi:hypothetical protein
MKFLTDSQIEEYETADDLVAFLDSLGEEDLVLNANGLVHVRRFLEGVNGFEVVTGIDWMKRGHLNNFKDVRIWHSFYKDRDNMTKSNKCEPHNQYEESGIPDLRGSL